MIADGSFGQRQQERLIERIGGALRGGIEAADGINFVTEKFDADWTLGFGRIDIKDAAAESVFAGHFNDVGSGVADGVEVGEKVIDVEGSAAAEDAGQVGVVIGGAEEDCRGCDWRDYDRRFASCNFPEGGGAFFLQLGMRGEILEWKHVAGGEGDYGVGIAGGGEFAEAAENGDEIFDGAVVVDYEDERTVGVAAQEH